MGAVTLRSYVCSARTAYLGVLNVCPGLEKHAMALRENASDGRRVVLACFTGRLTEGAPARGGGACAGPCGEVEPHGWLHRG